MFSGFAVAFRFVKFIVFECQPAGCETGKRHAAGKIPPCRRRSSAIFGSHTRRRLVAFVEDLRGIRQSMVGPLDMREGTMNFFDQFQRQNSSEALARLLWTGGDWVVVFVS